MLRIALLISVLLLTASLTKADDWIEQDDHVQGRTTTEAQVHDGASTASEDDDSEYPSDASSFASKALPTPTDIDSYASGTTEGYAQEWDWDQGANRYHETNALCASDNFAGTIAQGGYAQVDSEGTAAAHQFLKSTKAGNANGQIAISLQWDGATMSAVEKAEVDGMTISAQCMSSWASASYNSATDKWTWTGTINGNALNIDPISGYKGLADEGPFVWEITEIVDDDEVVYHGSSINFTGKQTFDFLYTTGTSTTRELRFRSSTEIDNVIQ